MSGFVTAISTGVTAFGATNIDDIVILTLFFSQVNATFRHWHIVAGQYLGFGALILASLPGFFGGLIVPHPWIGLFGLVPIAIGINNLLNRDSDESEEVKAEIKPSNPSFLAHFLNLQTLSVAGVTFANGSDNISIYVPLFANSSGPNLLIIISVFFTLVGILCFAAYKLTHLRDLAQLLTRYGHNLVPVILIGLGAFIIIESGLATFLTVHISEFYPPWT